MYKVTYRTAKGQGRELARTFSTPQAAHAAAKKFRDSVVWYPLPNGGWRGGPDA